MSAERRIREHQSFATKDEALVRVVVPLPAGGWHDYQAEALWAEPLGGDRYLLRSSPFLAFELAVEDVVEARPQGGELRLVRVLERGGGACYRLHCPRGPDAVADRLEALEEMEVTAEIDGEWVALDVPPHADLEEVYALLAEGEDVGAWTFEEGWATE